MDVFCRISIKSNERFHPKGPAVCGLINQDRVCEINQSIIVVMKRERLLMVSETFKKDELILYFRVLALYYFFSKFFIINLKYFVLRTSDISVFYATTTTTTTTAAIACIFRFDSHYFIKHALKYIYFIHHIDVFVCDYYYDYINITKDI